MIKFNMNYEGNEAGILPPNIEVTASIDKVRNEKIKRSALRQSATKSRILVCEM